MWLLYKYYVDMYMRALDAYICTSWNKHDHNNMFSMRGNNAISAGPCDLSSSVMTQSQGLA